ncbi:MAG: helix-turn-helix transcriptional regulator [Bacteroidota bacterium]
MPEPKIERLEQTEAAYIQLKTELGDRLRQRRESQKMTQHELARLIRSSQSRVAKMEAGDPSVSIDLLVRSLLALGTTREDLARTFPF